MPPQLLHLYVILMIFFSLSNICIWSHVYYGSCAGYGSSRCSSIKLFSILSFSVS
jgi:hypothetical protein